MQLQVVVVVFGRIWLWSDFLDQYIIQMMDGDRL